MAESFQVPITALRRSLGARRAEHRRGRIGRLSVAGNTVSADAVVDVEVVLSMLDGGIEVSGHVTAPWSGECRRCLRPVSGELSVGVRELYRPGTPSGRSGEAVAGTAGNRSAGDEDTYVLTGEALDLRPMARDALLLELPLAPLCRPDCAGLCPTCGADRNEEACTCAPDAGDPRWAGLDALGGK